MAGERARPAALAIAQLLCGLLLLVVSAPSAHAVPCPAVGVDARPDGYVLTSSPDSGALVRLIAPDCSVTTRVLDTEAGSAPSRPGRPVIIPIIGPAPVSKRVLWVQDYVIAHVHQLPANTQKLAFLTCPTFSGGADFTNARGLESVILSNCPSIETLDNVRFPDSVTYIGVENTKLKSIKNVVWPLNLQRLFLRSNKLTDIESSYPEFMTTLMLGGNPITALDKGTLPNRLSSMSLPAVTSIKGIKWHTKISLAIEDDATLTEFELRASDFAAMRNVLDNLSSQSTCTDPTATLETLNDNTFCVITDERFAAKYETTAPTAPVEGSPPPPTTVQPLVNATSNASSAVRPRPPPPTSTGSSSGSGSGGGDTLDDVKLPNSQFSVRGRKSTSKDDTQDTEALSTDGGDSNASPSNGGPGANGGQARRGSSSTAARTPGSPGGPSSDGGSSEASSSASATTRTTIFTLVGALIVVALFVTGYYRRSPHWKNAHDDSSESPTYGAFPGSPQSESGSSGDMPPLFGFLANDVRNDASLAPFCLPTSEVTLGKIVARGGFGVVHRGVYRGRDVAVKQMQRGTWRNEDALGRFMDEIRLCAKLNHPKIVEFVGISWTSLRDLSVVSELMGGGDLHDALRKQPTPSPVDWSEHWTSAKLQSKTAIACDVAEAVVYLHSRTSPVLHRDLKARNVLLDHGGNAKLSDFGISREVVVDETLTSEIGTAAWIAPEVLRGERYSDKADIYSFGVLLVELDLCRHPYDVDTNRDDDEESNDSSVSPTATGSHSAFRNANIILLVSTGKLRPMLSLECPGEIKTLAEQCLSFDPSNRPTASEVSQRLQGILANLTVSNSLNEA